METTKRMSVNELDNVKWDKSKNRSRVKGWCGTRVFIEHRDATKTSVTMWCAAVACNDAAEFEGMMFTSALSPPSRGGTHQLEDTAAAAEFDELMAASAADRTSHGEQCDLEDVAATDDEVCSDTAVEAEDVAGDDTAVAAPRSILTMLQGNAMT